jgi:menaquinone-dependent protoporphyrinogen oxidase
MSDVPVFYATTDGQTRRIAQHIADVLQAHGHASRALEVTSDAARDYDWRRTTGVVLAASLHRGTHQRTATDFARAHVDRFRAVPTWFVSVSLSAASRNPEEQAAAERIARAFVADLAWTPWRISCVAGRLAYTRYSFITRWFMRRIAGKEGASTDTSRDHELTDWTALAQQSQQFADQTARTAARIAEGLEQR